MNTLTWRNFYDLSLLSYFDTYEGVDHIPSFIARIISDEALIDDHKDDLLFQMNIESVRHIQVNQYHNFYIKDVLDDNLHSGVYLYRIAYGEEEIIAIRGSEELDGIHHKTGWQDWMDNFRMFLDGPTYQQLIALHYMNQLPTNNKRYLCGHSKGGNLAIFIAMAASQQLFDSLIQVVSFNAPGITNSLMRDYEQRIKDASFQTKVTLIENEHDCISAFFNHVLPPHIIASTTPANTFEQLYENHYLHTMSIASTDFILVTKKSAMPRMTQHFINDFFVRLGKERLEKIVARMDEYFLSGLSKAELYRVLIYQISKYTNLFDELSYEEVHDITFQDLIQRRRTRLIYQKLKTLRPQDNVANVIQSFKEDNPLQHLNELDIRSITNSFMENYEITFTNTAAGIVAKVSENNRRIMDAIANIQSRLRNDDTVTSLDNMQDETLDKG